MLRDTTEFSFKRDDFAPVGIPRKVVSGVYPNGRIRHYTACGILMPIEEKESIRWLENLRQSTGLLGELGRCVHIGDRESDIYELFCTAIAPGRIFCSEPAWIVWPVMARTRSPQKWQTWTAKGCTELKCAMITASCHLGA